MLPPALCTSSPPTPGSPPGSPQPGDSPLSAPACGSQGRFGGELTFFQHLKRGFGVGGSEERGEQRAPARHCSVSGCLGPPLFSCCHSLALGVSPSPRGAGGVLAELGWGEMRDVLCFGVPASSLRGRRDLGHQSLPCHPSRQLRPLRLPAREEDPPGGFGEHQWGWGASSGVLGVRVLRGFGVLKGGSWRCSGCVFGVRARGSSWARSGCELRL